MIARDRALAVSFAEGPEAALPLLASLEESLGDYGPFHAASGDVQRRLGDDPAARAAYERALARARETGPPPFVTPRERGGKERGGGRPRPPG